MSTPEQTPVKKVVSPFELAITEIADPEAAKNMRAETSDEKSARLRDKFEGILKTVKAKEGSPLDAWKKSNQQQS